MKKIYFLFILISNLSIAQNSKFSVRLDLNSCYNGNLNGREIPARLKKVDAGIINSSMIGFYYNSIGIKPNSLFSVKHGIDFLIPISKSSINGVFPEEMYSYLSNSLNINFVRAKNLNSFLIFDGKLLLNKERFKSNNEFLTPRLFTVSAGFGVHPLPKKNQILFSALIGLNSIYSYSGQSPFPNFYNSTLKLEYVFKSKRKS